MLKELAELKGDGAKRKKLFEAFRIEVQSHAAAEEESLYACWANPSCATMRATRSPSIRRLTIYWGR